MSKDLDINLESIWTCKIFMHITNNHACIYIHVHINVDGEVGGGGIRNKRELKLLTVAIRSSLKWEMNTLFLLS